MNFKELFENKTIIRLDCSAINMWTFYFSDGTSAVINTEVRNAIGIPGMEATVNDKLYVVEGYVDKTYSVKESYATESEANEAAKSHALHYKNSSFAVRHPKWVFGLDDHHYKFDKYFNDAVQYCHND